MTGVSWKRTLLILVVYELAIALVFVGLQVPMFTTNSHYLASRPGINNALDVDGWSFWMASYTFTESLSHKLTGVGYCSVSVGFPEKSWYVNASQQLARYPAMNDLRDLEARLKANVSDAQFQELAAQPYPYDLCDEYSLFTDIFLVPITYTIFLALAIGGGIMVIRERQGDGHGI